MRTVANLLLRLALVCSLASYTQRDTFPKPSSVDVADPLAHEGPWNRVPA